KHVTALVKEIRDQKLDLRPNCAARTMLADIEPIARISQEVGVKIEVSMFVGSSEIRKYTEDWDLDSMMRNSEESLKFCQKEDLPVMYVTEDTTRAHPDTIEKLYGLAIDYGAKRICFCDTVGHSTPEGAFNLITFATDLVKKKGRDVLIDWHGHSDRGLGIWNSIAALRAGADRIHGCALGIGERVGNAPMDLMLVNLKLLGLLPDRIDLRVLPEYVETVSRCCRVPIPTNYPVFGSDAFETGTGVHAAAVIKALRKGDDWLANRVYSGVPADEVGREQKIRVGPMSGKSNVLYWLEKRGFDATDARVERIFRAAKESPRLLTDEEILQLVDESSN
ncbi:MAG: 2-isopropylmalate synthase, partial [Planctomycetota bacterium]|nr:2-isopropylmalate synthase [Planctomycetota bacterium]